MADVRNEELRCGLRALQIVNEEMVRLDIPPQHSTHMSGAIRLCRSVLPTVVVIYVYAGCNLDIVYREEAGKWTAHCQRRKA